MKSAKENGIKEYIRNNWKKIWYMLCFLALGIIDQRRGSARGNIQMAAANCIGIVLAAIVVPSLKWEGFRHRSYLFWTVISVVFGTAAGIWGYQNWSYQEQWITGVLNVVVWGYLVIYILREWKQWKVSVRLKQPFFWCVGVMLLLMFFSAHEGLTPVWMLLIFGGFYLIGISCENREDFFQGMLNGIILWFFVQQIVAYGFRPYDYVRYRGLYSGETQNGIFYMIVYCAFLCKWIWAKDYGKHRISVWIYFFLSAGSISFLLMTGGRSSLMGAAMATLAVYTIRDIVWKKSFYRWLLHVALLGLCVVITFPLVYGTIRYLPAIMHHPVWFEGEYIEGSSVNSLDPWDSEKYISFEEAVDMNIGRILSLLGIDITEWKDNKISSSLIMRVKAAEMSEPGSSPENPFGISDEDRSSPVGLRKTIYICYLQHLNLWGHSKDEFGFYLDKYYQTQHAHNMFLQMAYDYGIPVGILFLGLVLYSLLHFLICAFRGEEDKKWICLAFFLAVLFYGLTEMAVVSGMITWVMIYLLFYFAGEDSRIVGKRQSL